MLEIELDVFSGMPNPKWLLSSGEEQELVERVSAGADQVSRADSPDEQFSLGYRGLLVRRVKPDDGPWDTAARARGGVILPDEFRVGSRSAATDSVADWLLQTSGAARKNSRVTDELREVAARGVARVERTSDAANPDRFAGLPGIRAVDDGDPDIDRFPVLTGEGAHVPNENRSAAEGVAGRASRGSTWWACGSSYFSANASYFNDPQHVTRNNCYCFASNHLAGVRYALPGRRGGRPATSMTCAEVTAGLYADGWRDGCQPNGLTIVMVIWPGNDYHFYRLVTGGPNWWWGHKPGGTPAKYTDDCGHGIYQYNGQGYAPNNCCRGGYTDFCGYFYQDNNTAYVA